MNHCPNCAEQARLAGLFRDQVAATEDALSRERARAHELEQEVAYLRPRNNELCMAISKIEDAYETGYGLHGAVREAVTIRQTRGAT